MFNQRNKHKTDTPFVSSRGLSWRLATLLLLSVMLTGCIGTVVGAAVDTTIEVAKVPFKVGGAVVDLAVGDDEDDD